MITAAEGSPLATVPTNEGRKEVTSSPSRDSTQTTKPLLGAGTRRAGLL